MDFNAAIAKANIIMLLHTEHYVIELVVPAGEVDIPADDIQYV